MTDNEIIKALEVCSYATSNKDCKKCPYYPDEECVKKQFIDILDLINRQKAENERLNKNYEELIYKTECLLCHATGNKFSKYTYTTQEMISFVDDYIQDCCDEAVEEAKEAVKSEVIKEFAYRLKYLVIPQKAYGYTHEIVLKRDIDNLVKEMTE